MNQTFRSPDEACEYLAEELYFKLEHLDPSDVRHGDIDWASLSDDEKELYRLAVMWILHQREAVSAAQGDAL